MRRREGKPMDHQRAAVRAELHSIVDKLVDDWPWIDSLAGQVRAASGGRSAKGDHADPTAAAGAYGDPAARWLDRFRALRVEMRLMDGARANLAPATPKRGRANSVEVCELCKMPTVKVRRVDGLPYCPTSCFYKVWRTKERPA